jgi:hypothetical protein
MNVTLLKIVAVIVALSIGIFTTSINVTAGETGKDGRFIAYDNGTVLDTKTNLMWAKKDNGGDIDWHNAKSYCKNYRGGGYKDWRMPTLAELGGIYDAQKSRLAACDQSIKIHVVTELIDITCFAPWASEIRGQEAVWFNFAAGKQAWDIQSININGRVLPVRSYK